jgi:glycosyltransferase involved in cell wall biosynthesis
MENKPLISVIIPNYNREIVICETVQSVLDQSYENIEVLVIDDASTDHSVEMLTKMQDKRIRCIVQKEHRGANYCRNLGVSESKGEYLAFQDSGTIWYPDKLPKQMDRLKKSPEAGLVYCIVEVEDGRDTYWHPERELELCYKEEKCKEILRKRNLIGTPTILLRRDYFFEVGRFDEDLLRWQDYDFVIRVVQKYSVVIVNEILAKDPFFENGISNKFSLFTQALPKFLTKHKDFFDSETDHFELLENIFFRILRQDKLSYENFLKFIYGINQQLEQDLADVVSDCAGRAIQRKTALGELGNRLTEYNFRCFMQEVKEGKHFAIYGTGNYAMRLLKALRRINCERTVLNMIVTEKSGSDFFEGIPVVTVDEFKDKKNTSVLIGTVDKTQQEIVDILCDKGYRKIIIFRNEFFQMI